MSTSQSNEVPNSGQNAVEQKVTPLELCAIRLDLDPGQELELVHWALSDLKDKFYEQAADYLADRDIISYLQATKDIATIDELIASLIVKLSRSYQELLSLHRGVDMEYNDKLARLQELEKITELQVRFFDKKSSQ